MTKCIGLILKLWDTESIGSLFQGLCVLTVQIFKPDFSLLWLLVTSSGNIHPSDSESLNGTSLPPRLVFKHSNVPSQSTFWQGKQIEFCKSSTVRDFLQPVNYSCLSTSCQIFQYLIKLFILELSVEALVPWMRSPWPFALSLQRIVFSLFSQHDTGAHSGSLSGQLWSSQISAFHDSVFLLCSFALGSYFLDASCGAVSKSSL